MRKHRLSKIKNLDVFVLLNLLIFAFMCVFVYYDRFIQYRGKGNVHEFFVYALTISVFVGIAWWYLRHFTFKTSMLALCLFGILAHFFGAFIPIEGGRLYDAHIFGVRYDKYVHLVNAFAAVAIMSHLFDLLEVQLPLIRNVVILLAVLGLGAAVEIVEYLVMLTVPNAGVGGYDNNMQDLVANLVGGAFFFPIHRLCSKTRAWWGKRARGIDA